MDAYYRFANAVERRVPATLLIVVAGVLFLGSVFGVRQAGGEGTGESVTAPPESTTTTAAPATTSVPSTAFADFERATFTITPKDKPPSTHCGLVALTPEQRAKGLMGQQNLAGYAGMLFVFDAPIEAAFYMANVPAPLQVAWFSESGEYVSGADMPVCTVAANECPLYRATGPFRVALETFQGGMEPLQVGPGASLTVGAAGSCA
jgi:uncharacterized membrane protein (UPF0127 family)